MSGRAEAQLPFITPAGCWTFTSAAAWKALPVPPNVVVVVADEERYWTVHYSRAPATERREISAVTYATRDRSRKVEGNFLDLTALFEAEGFKRIGHANPFSQLEPGSALTVGTSSINAG